MINHSPVLHGSNEVTHIGLFTPIRLVRLVRERIVSIMACVSVLSKAVTYIRNVIIVRVLLSGVNMIFNWDILY